MEADDDERDGEGGEEEEWCAIVDVFVIAAVPSSNVKGDWPKTRLLLSLLFMTIEPVVVIIICCCCCGETLIASNDVNISVVLAVAVVYVVVPKGCCESNLFASEETFDCEVELLLVVLLLASKSSNCVKSGDVCSSCE